MDQHIFNFIADWIIQMKGQYFCSNKNTKIFLFFFYKDVPIFFIRSHDNFFSFKKRGHK